MLKDEWTLPEGVLQSLPHDLFLRYLDPPPRDDLIIHDLKTGAKMRIQTASGSIEMIRFSKSPKKLFINTSKNLEIVDVPEHITKPMAKLRRKPRRRRA